MPGKWLRPDLCQRRKRILKCQTRTFNAKIAEQRLPSPRVSKNFIRKKDSITNHNAVRNAARQENRPETVVEAVTVIVKKGKCSQLPVPSVEKRRRFPSDRQVTNQFTARNAIGPEVAETVNY